VSGDKARSVSASPGRNAAAAAFAAAKAVVFAGPTACGKSAAALAAARHYGGVVINADSMQVYRELAVLTARPDAAAMASVPHRLYGTIGAGERFSAARWRELAVGEIEAAASTGRLPILAGGTGLYIRTLQRGLAPLPAIPAAIRREGAALLERDGSRDFHARLAALDAESARAIPATDRQRLLRAWEVAVATGAPLPEWRRRATPPGDAPRLLVFAFLPPRAALYTACDRRFAAMIEAGAIEEVRALLALGLDPAAPAMKAVGVREIAAFLAGAMTQEAMIARGQQATRNYAKRQYTWFRHQLPGPEVVPAQFSESLSHEIFKKIDDFLLT
jgi:tRNA dimethylallyltransferase